MTIHRNGRRNHLSGAGCARTTASGWRSHPRRMWMVPILLAGFMVAYAGQAMAQLRASSVDWQEVGGCRVETQLPGGSQLRWHATVNEGRDSVLRITIIEGSETHGTAAVEIDESWVQVRKCEVYGAGDHEIAVVHMGTIQDDYPKDATASVVSFVRLSPDLEHLFTSVIRTRTGIGDSRFPIDYFSWFRGDGYARSNFEIVPSDGTLRAVRVETRRPMESQDELVIGASSRVIGQNEPSYAPPGWLSERQTAVAPFDNPVYRPLAPVATPEGIVAVLSAEPENMFPPRTFVIDLQVGQRRAHGLLFRDLGTARSGDRHSAKIGVEDFMRSLKSQPDRTKGVSGAPADFRWSDGARSMIGTPRLDVAVMNDTTIIGTIERECPEAPLGEAAPRDLWIFRIDMQDGDPAWIESELVASCALVPVRGLDNLVFLYRTFDNGRVEPRVVDGVTVGLRAVLEPARPVFSKGDPRIAEWAELKDHRKWVEVEYLLENFDPLGAEIIY